MKPSQPDNSDEAQHTSKPRRPPPIRPKLQYLNGLPLLSPSSPSSRAPLPPVFYRECTPGKCLQCALASARCEFFTSEQKLKSSGPCGRCRRVGGVCLVRRLLESADWGRDEISGAQAGDWIAAETGGVGDADAVRLAGELLAEGRRGRRRDICGVAVGEVDLKGWALPKPCEVEDEVEEEEVYWKRLLPKRLNVKRENLEDEVFETC
ncbi:hypothetical protein CGCS363_v001484 [Colletotrichum siamense]|uniref:uncharacterized protein n=1 Tax=Colletotrichum siamense TaxID=690259 RepID=UPI0018727394|nr:uncharacterized protein CGCS363_v001484 [Colletotrichum siamense]KAF5516176.1 hypothetical protein CGCS363_v001484 [Colletotrichum siamense]